MEEVEQKVHFDQILESLTEELKNRFQTKTKLKFSELNQV